MLLQYATHVSRTISVVKTALAPTVFEFRLLSSQMSVREAEI